MWCRRCDDLLFQRRGPLQREVEGLVRGLAASESPLTRGPGARGGDGHVGTAQWCALGAHDRDRFLNLGEPQRSPL